MKRKVAMAMVAQWQLVHCSSGNGRRWSSWRKIGISMPTQSLERWNRDGSYLQKQFEDAGYEVELTGYLTTRQTVRVNDIPNLISDGVNPKLVVAAIDGEALNTVMDEAADAGIQVISDRLIKSDAVSYYISFDNYTGGTLLGTVRSRYSGSDNAGDKTYNIEFTAGDPG